MPFIFYFIAITFALFFLALKKEDFTLLVLSSILWIFAGLQLINNKFIDFSMSFDYIEAVGAIFIALGIYSIMRGAIELIIIRKEKKEGQWLEKKRIIQSMKRQK